MKSLIETFEVIVAPGQWVTLGVMWTSGQASSVDEVMDQFRTAGMVPVPGHFVSKLKEQFRDELGKRTLAHYTNEWDREVVVDPIKGVGMERGKCQKIKADGFIAMQKPT